MFKNLAGKLKRNGDDVIFFIQSRDIIEDLVKSDGFDYKHSVSKNLRNKFKSKFGKGKGKPSSPPLMSPFPSSRRRRRRILPRRTPPANVRRTSPGMPERRILLPAPEKPKSPSRRPLGKSKTQKELDGVLKKLKDMSK